MLNLLKHSERQDDDGTTIQVRLKHMALSVFEQNTNNHHVYNPATASGSQPQQFQSVVLPPSGMSSNAVNPVSSCSGVNGYTYQEWSTPHTKLAADNHLLNNHLLNLQNSVDRHTNDDLMKRCKKNGNITRLDSHTANTLIGMKATRIAQRQFKDPASYSNFMCGTDLAIQILEEGKGRLAYSRPLTTSTAIPERFVNPDPKRCVLFCGSIMNSNGQKGSIFAYLDPTLDDNDETKLIRFPEVTVDQYDNRKTIVLSHLYPNINLTIKVRRWTINYTVCAGNSDRHYLLLELKAARCLEKQLKCEKDYGRSFIGATAPGMRRLTEGTSRLILDAMKNWHLSEQECHTISKNLEPPNEDCVLVFGHLVHKEKISYSLPIAMFLDPNLDDNPLTKDLAFPVIEHVANLQSKVHTAEDGMKVDISAAVAELNGIHNEAPVDISTPVAHPQSQTEVIPNVVREEYPSQNVLLPHVAPNQYSGSYNMQSTSWGGNPTEQPLQFTPSYQYATVPEPLPDISHHDIGAILNHFPTHDIYAQPVYDTAIQYAYHVPTQEMQWDDHQYELPDLSQTMDVADVLNNL